MITRTYKDIEVIVFTHLSGTENVDKKQFANTKVISFPSGNLLLSGNYLIISVYSDHTEESVETSHVFDLHTVKSYRGKI